MLGPVDVHPAILYELHQVGHLAVDATAVDLYVLVVFVQAAVDDRPSPSY